VKTLWLTFIIVGFVTSFGSLIGWSFTLVTGWSPFIEDPGRGQSFIWVLLSALSTNVTFLEVSRLAGWVDIRFRNGDARN
jgi:hypothetical protein